MYYVYLIRSVKNPDKSYIGFTISAVLYRDTSIKCHIDDGGRWTSVDTKYFAMVKAAYAKQQETKRK
jgi:hypothetical protein